MHEMKPNWVKGDQEIRSIGLVKCWRQVIIRTSSLTPSTAGPLSTFQGTTATSSKDMHTVNLHEELLTVTAHFGGEKLVLYRHEMDTWRRTQTINLLAYKRGVWLHACTSASLWCVTWIRYEKCMFETWFATHWRNRLNLSANLRQK